MKLSYRLALASCLLFSASFALAEDGIVLAKKGYVGPVGTVLSKEMSMALQDAALNVDAGGQQIEGTMTRAETTKDTVEALSATKLRRIVTGKDSGGKMVIGGQEQPVPPTPDPLLSLPVIAEKADGKWTASLESGEKPTPDQQSALEKAAKQLNDDSEFEMYGDKPRKTGDKWKVDPSKIGFGGGTDLKGDYALEFVGTKEFQGMQCAVLKATFDFTGTTEEEEGSPKMSMNLKGEATIHRSIKDMVDVDVDMNCVTTLSGAPNPQVTMEVKGPTKISQKVTIKRP